MYDLLNRIHSFPGTAAFLDRIERWRAGGTGPCILSFCNAHAVNMALKNPGFRDDLLSSSLVLRDGSGVRIAMKTLGMDPGANLNGTDLIPLLLKALPRARLGLYGTEEPWLGQAASVFGTTHDIAATMDGFQPDDAYVQAVLRDRPAIVLLGMGMPKQERIARKLAATLDYPCLIINGGAILDFTAQRFDRAPRWMRRIGLEWLFRLLNEPGRLFGRYVIGNTAFLARLGLCALRRTAEGAPCEKGLK